MPCRSSSVCAVSNGSLVRASTCDGSSARQDHRAGRVVHERLMVDAGDQLAGHAVMEQQPALRYPNAGVGRRRSSVTRTRAPAWRPVDDPEVRESRRVAVDLVHRNVGNPDPRTIVGDAGRQVAAHTRRHHVQVPHRAVQRGETQPA